MNDSKFCLFRKRLFQNMINDPPFIYMIIMEDFLLMTIDFSKTIRSLILKQPKYKNFYQQENIFIAIAISHTDDDHLRIFQLSIKYKSITYSIRKQKVISFGCMFSYLEALFYTFIFTNLAIPIKSCRFHAVLIYQRTRKRHINYT